ncbi:protein GLUTAMINE DUMPER 5-like [Nymphaea colorata]|uniref:Protein GLUTAMINE DUMPER 3 n=1 Tax=Nymphaea colorata TaxID=210225 RepID=A0A5K1BJV1_9MAGN|nr:protein GLUTAMINE DUMPER 5-like [Nymphaea colorata]
MRPDSSFNATSLSGQQQHSPWHSPVPYLFGGLAAMLGLIAFALLILACSYWKLSGYFENGEGSQGGEVGEEGEKPLEIKVCSGLEDQKIVVIMAGDQKPSFIATPMSSKGSSINLTKGVVDSCDQAGEKKQIDDHNQSHEHLQVHDNQNQVHHQGQNQEEEQHQSQRQNQGDENQ